MQNGVVSSADAGLEASKPSRTANVVATVVALSAAIVASPEAIAALPSKAVVVLRAVATLGHTLQPVVVTAIGVVVAAVTRPPHWLASLGRHVR